MFSLPHAARTALPECRGAGPGRPVLGTPSPAAPHPHGPPLLWRGTSAMSGLVSACHLVEGARTASPRPPCSILCRPPARSTGGCSKKGDAECPSADLGKVQHQLATRLPGAPGGPQPPGSGQEPHRVPQKGNQVLRDPPNVSARPALPLTASPQHPAASDPAEGRLWGLMWDRSSDIPISTAPYFIRLISYRHITNSRR